VSDEALMRLALREARRGRPSPNPHVGAVIAKGDRVIAVGHHPKAGGPHAEIVALDRARSHAKGATVYVSLEPCNHFGRTPPCTDALIAAGVARVVIGARDPTGHTKGTVAKLSRAGIEVTRDVLRDEAETVIVDFAKHARTGVPFVTLKSAVTLDGRTATRTGDSEWITGERARREAHRLRRDSDAVLTGSGTVAEDDPLLTVRAVRGPSPLRAVADTKLSISPDAALVRTAREVPTLVYHGKAASSAKKKALVRAGVELVEVRSGPGGLDLGELLADLGRRGVVRLLLESGPKLAGAFLAQNLVDRCAIFVAPMIVGDASALPLAWGARVDQLSGAHRLERVEVRRFGPDLLVTGELGHARAWLARRKPDNRRRP
jgi:diaminohydroxyphosphoribosylaminopyrimidine deaminase / 5-amino-6-(5-phosphoribosylamino)uracil reductase